MKSTGQINKIIRITLLSAVSAAGCSSANLFDRKSTAAKKADLREEETSKPGLPPANPALVQMRKGEDELAAYEDDKDQKHLEAARKQFEAVIKKQPTNSAAHHRLAVTADLLNNFPLADIHYKTALQLEPDNADIWGDYGYSFLLQRRYDEAEGQLQQAYRRDPRNQTVIKNLATVYSKQGRFDLAERELRKIMPDSEVRREVATWRKPAPESNDDSPDAAKKKDGLLAKMGLGSKEKKDGPSDATQDLYQKMHAEKLRSEQERELRLAQQGYPQKQIDTRFNPQRAVPLGNLAEELARVDGPPRQRSTPLEVGPSDPFYDRNSGASQAGYSQNPQQYSPNDYPADRRQSDPNYDAPRGSRPGTIEVFRGTPNRNQAALDSGNGPRNNASWGGPDPEPRLEDSRRDYSSERRESYANNARYPERDNRSDPRYSDSRGNDPRYGGSNRDQVIPADGNNRGRDLVIPADGSGRNDGPVAAQRDGSGYDNRRDGGYDNRRGDYGNGRNDHPRNDSHYDNGRRNPAADRSAYEDAKREAATLGMGIGPGSMFPSADNVTPTNNAGTGSMINGAMYRAPERHLPTNVIQPDLNNAFVAAPDAATPGNNLGQRMPSGPNLTMPKPVYSALETPANYQSSSNAPQVGDQFSSYEAQRIQSDRNLNGAMQSGWGNSPANYVQSPARGAQGYTAPEVQRPQDVWANSLPNLANSKPSRSGSDREANGSANNSRGGSLAAESQAEIKSRRNDLARNAPSRNGIVEPEPYQSRGNDVTSGGVPSYGPATQTNYRSDDDTYGSRGSDSQLPRISPRRDR